MVDKAYVVKSFHTIRYDVEMQNFNGTWFLVVYDKQQYREVILRQSSKYFIEKEYEVFHNIYFDERY